MPTSNPSSADEDWEPPSIQHLQELLPETLQNDESEHGFLLYQSTLEVPIIAAGPGIPEIR